MEWKYCFIACKGKQLMTLSSWKNWKKRQNYTDLIKNTRSLLSSLNSTLQWLDSNQGPPSWCWSDFRWSLERHSQRQPVFISNYYQNRATTNIEPIPISISKPPTTRRRSSPTNRAPTHNTKKTEASTSATFFFSRRPSSVFYGSGENRLSSDASVPPLATFSSKHPNIVMKKSSWRPSFFSW